MASCGLDVMLLPPIQHGTLSGAARTQYLDAQRSAAPRSLHGQLDHLRNGAPTGRWPADGLPAVPCTVRCRQRACAACVPHVTDPTYYDERRQIQRTHHEIQSQTVQGRDTGAGVCGVHGGSRGPLGRTDTETVVVGSSDDRACGDVLHRGLCTQGALLMGNAVAVICASLMCAITSSLGTHHDAQTLVYALTPTLAFAATEYASVLFVKTMIRKHGDSRYYALSMGYHLIVAVLGFAVRPLWGLAACVLLARACALPLIKRRIRPMYIGMVEIATSLMNWLAIVLGAA